MLFVCMVFPAFFEPPLLYGFSRCHSRYIAAYISYAFPQLLWQAQSVWMPLSLIGGRIVRGLGRLVL